MADSFVSRLGAVNDVLNLYVLVVLLIGAGVVLTIATRGVQLRRFGTMVSTALRSRRGATDGISAFQAFALGMATRIGIGNITGVALALVLGGPGAIFWMWAISLVGMATSFAEASLAQLFKQPAGDGAFRGGPAWYISAGLRSRFLGVVFAVLMILTMVIAMPMVQANSIAAQARLLAEPPAIGLGPISVDPIALVLAALTAIVVVGGLRKVARVTEWLTPLMAALYMVLALIVVVMNIGGFPQFISDIMRGAFGLDQALAGTAGGFLAALLNGARRGLFSNEAGMGTNPHAAATATVAHPARQGFLQSFGVFVDTFFICTSTAFIILSVGERVYVPGVTGADGSDLSGTLTTQALAIELGDWVAWVMLVVIFFFGFSSILGAYVYAETNIVFLGDQRWIQVLAQISIVVCTYVGSVAALLTVWTLMDTAMAIVTIVNLLALLALTKHVAGILRDWETSRAAGIEEPELVISASALPAGLTTEWWHEGRTGRVEPQRALR